MLLMENKTPIQKERGSEPLKIDINNIEMYRLGLLWFHYEKLSNNVQAKREKRSFERKKEMVEVLYELESLRHSFLINPKLDIGCRLDWLVSSATVQKPEEALPFLIKEFKSFTFSPL